MDHYLRAAQKHLEWATADAYGHGLCYRVKQLITASTRFGYYSGAITCSAPHSNHVLALGNFGGSSYPLVLDGCPERNAASDAGRLGLMQMFPHSCAPNCKVAIIETIPGLELHVIEALVDIPVGAYPTFNYDALATETEKRRGKTFWRWFQPFFPKDERAGVRRIQCLCAGVPGRCPNGLWRDERIMKLAVFDQSPPIRPSSPPAIPPQQLSLMGQNAKCTSPYSLTPPQRYTAGGTELVPVGSGYRKRQSVMDPSQALSAPAASRAKSNDRRKSRHGTQMLLNPRVHASSPLVQSRQVLLGVYVLPQLFDAVRRGRLSDFLSHLMHSTRREIQNLNARGVAPRGRPGKPLERIEVDLSFLRSLDQPRNVRVAAQRIFVSSHVDMYRELSTILDEVMMKFRAVIEEIVGADTGDWSYFAYAAEALPDTPS